MINNQLLDFIKEETKKGASKEVITKELLGAGWDNEDLNEAFNAINIANPNLVPEKKIEPRIEPKIIEPKVEASIQPKIEPVVNPIINPIVNPIATPPVENKFEIKPQPAQNQTFEQIQKTIEPKIEQPVSALPQTPVSNFGAMPFSNFNNQSNVITPKTKSGSAVKTFLIIFFVFVLVGGVLGYFFKDQLKTLPIIKNIFPMEVVVMPENTMPIQEVNEVVPKDVSVVDDDLLGNNFLNTTDCGLISYGDYVILMFGDAESAKNISNSSMNSIKCISNALLSCNKAKLNIEGTNPFDPNDTTIISKTFNVSEASKSSECMLNECALPREVILHQNQINKDKFFFTLIGFGPQGATKTGNNDMYDPVTKKNIINVCPAGKNPFI